MSLRKPVSGSDSRGQTLWILGQGYVGIPLAMAAVAAGYAVTGVDVDESKVDLILGGNSPTQDIKASEIVAALRSGHYSVASTLPDDVFSIAVITVPTPLERQVPDLGYVESAARALGSRLVRDCTVILESTTYPGTTDQVIVPILERESGLIAGVDFFVGYSPERIDPGNPEWGLLNTPKLVSGINQESLEKVNSFYEALGIQTVRVSGTREAELSKLLENTFRHVNIALVNELAMFASSLGVDVRDAIDAASTKPFGYMPFRPGPGVGGHCLPIDPSYLSWAVHESSGSEFQFIDLANSINFKMPIFVRDKIANLLEIHRGQIDGSKVLLVGMAYKSGTADMRESPGLALSALLGEIGVTVFGADHNVPDSDFPPGLIGLGNRKDHKFDLGVLLNPPSASQGPYEALEWCEIILDTRGVLDAPNVVSLWA